MAGGMKMYGKHRMPGRLFVVEGIDGSGKSTQLMLLNKWLESEGYVVYFSEWNSSPLVQDVTNRGKKKKMLTPMTFSLIHATDFADRYERQLAHVLEDLCELDVVEGLLLEQFEGQPVEHVAVFVEHLVGLVLREFDTGSSAPSPASGPTAPPASSSAPRRWAGRSWSTITVMAAPASP